MLVLWDTLFSVDPSLKIIDLVCTAMLLRIRWECRCHLQLEARGFANSATVLEADYSVALQLLLKYPAPQAAHGPHTFIDDAVYLRDHLDFDGGSTLTMKYTGKEPTKSTPSVRPTTPTASKVNPRQDMRGARSPLSPTRFPSRFIQQQGGVEALFQGAAKGILERSEKLGVNQAVRDALVEIRRNVNEARSNTIKAGRDLFSETSPDTTAMQAVAMLDRRNKQLAVMLDDTIASLKRLAASDLDDKQKHSEALEVAAARIQFVKFYLEDSTVALPEETDPRQLAADTVVATEPELPTEAVAAMVINTPEIGPESPRPATTEAPEPAPAAQAEQAEQVTMSNTDDMDTDALSDSTIVTAAQGPTTLQRPQAPIPTRSTLAQSSFAWMLEPDQSASSTAQTPRSSLESSRPKAANKHHKKPSSNANRERTAFLFGEVPSGAEDGTGVLPEDIFGLQPMGKSKERGKLWDD